MRQIELCYALLEVVTRQEEIINEQNKLIAKLVNENFEQESLIGELLKQEECLY